MVSNKHEITNKAINEVDIRNEGFLNVTEEKQGELWDLLYTVDSKKIKETNKKNIFEVMDNPEEFLWSKATSIKNKFTDVLYKIMEKQENVNLSIWEYEEMDELIAQNTKISNAIEDLNKILDNLFGPDNENIDYNEINAQLDNYQNFLKGYIH